MAAAGGRIRSFVGAFSIRGFVDPLHTIVTQHRQLPGKLCQLFPAQNALRFRAAYHDRILADSLVLRHGIAEWNRVDVVRLLAALGSVSIRLAG